MDRNQIVNKIEEILDDAQTGIMTTIDPEGRPSLRWMTPAVLKYPSPAIYCFSIPRCEKLNHIAANNNVVWMIQRRDLREIVKIEGTANIIDNPATKGELFDRIGARLETFFKANTNAEEFVVIETVIEMAEYYMPIKGIVETVLFSPHKEHANRN
jgi:general stress protein 26